MTAEHRCGTPGMTGGKRAGASSMRHWAVLMCVFLMTLLSPTEGTPIRVITFTTPEFGNTSSWHIDHGDVIHGYYVPIPPGKQLHMHIWMEYVVEVPDGRHMMNYFGNHDHGWHGGYWKIERMDGSHVAGGATTGLVTGSGGETQFCIGIDCAQYAQSVQVDVVVHIHTGAQKAYEIVCRGGRILRGGRKVSQVLGSKRSEHLPGHVPASVQLSFGLLLPGRRM